MSWPVSRILFRTAASDHGSEAATIHLDTPLPGASSGLPADSGEQPSNACAAAPGAAFLALLRVGFAKPLRSPGMLVRSYRTFSPLPPGGRRSVFCGTFPRVASDCCWQSPCSAKSGLSSNHLLGVPRPPSQLIRAINLAHVPGATGPLSPAGQGSGRRALRGSHHRRRPCGRGGTVAGTLQPDVHADVRRVTPCLSTDQASGTRGVATSPHRPLGGRHLRDGRIAERGVVHDEFLAGVRHAARRDLCAGAQLHPGARHAPARRQPRSQDSTRGEDGRRRPTVASSA